MSNLCFPRYLRERNVNVLRLATGCSYWVIMGEKEAAVPSRRLESHFKKEWSVTNKETLK